MEGLGELFGGVGLFLCVGAIIVGALLAMAIRAFSRPRATGPYDPREPRGPEAPRYDDPDIQTQGGFGGVPTTGSVQDFERDIDRDRVDTVGSSGFGGGARSFGDEPDRNRTDDDDDDQVSSKGGFGKG